MRSSVNDIMKRFFRHSDAVFWSCMVRGVYIFLDNLNTLYQSDLSNQSSSTS